MMGMTIDDAINRYTSNAFYEKTDGNLQGYLEFNQLAEWLKELKQLREHTRWIPVSERSPDDSGEYLVSVTDKEDEDYKQVGAAWFAHPKDYDIQDGEWRELMIDEIVVAWMPKPKPYEPQESEVRNEKY